MYRRILVPLDGSEHSEAALAHARDLAGAVGARIEIVRAVTVPTLVGTMTEVALPPSFDAGAEQAQVGEYLEARAAPLREGGLEVVCRVLEGPAGEAVLQHVEETRPDLLVLSFHGRRGFKRWLQGSTAERIARRSPCPVLIVKPGQATWADPGPRTGCTPPDRVL